jgi:hypothetical protein
MSSISGIPGGSSSISEQIAMLEEQMFRYSEFAKGSSTASADYKALQYAISTRNIADAQAALARLQLDSQSTGQPALTTSPPPLSNDGSINVKA